MKNEIYDYDERLERYRQIIAGFGRNGTVALQFLDHLASLGLSTARLSKVASHIPALLRAIDFNLESATRRDVERIVAWINRQPYRELTKRDKKLVLRKLIQYAKVGSVEFRRDYCVITVNGKTGIKRIPLVASYMPLLEWVRVHSNRDGPNAPLWISLAQNYYGHPLTYRHFRL